jgi:hypothetical protein
MKRRDQRIVCWSLAVSDYELGVLRSVGYRWVRTVEQSWTTSLRNPTVGQLIELTTYRDVGSVPVMSEKGQFLLRRLAI